LCLPLWGHVGCWHHHIVVTWHPYKSGYFPDNFSFHSLTQAAIMSSLYPQESFQNTTFERNSFWWGRRKNVRKNTLQGQLDILKSTGRYDAFRLKWHPTYDNGYKALFWDSDVAKWLEGACYFLAEKGDVEEDKVIDYAVKNLTDMIASAQWEDGYLNIHFTAVKPGLRFTNIRDLHELSVL
jgi:DUF1680 family protein